MPKRKKYLYRYCVYNLTLDKQEIREEGRLSKSDEGRYCYAIGPYNNFYAYKTLKEAKADVIEGAKEKIVYYKNFIKTLGGK